MKYFLLLMSLLFTAACGSSIDTPCDVYECEDLDDSSTCRFCPEDLNAPPLPYESKVGDWDSYKCEPPWFTEGPDSSVIIGRIGYEQPCFFKSEPVDTTPYRSTRKFRITFTQEPESSSTVEFPFYTHLFIESYNGPSLINTRLYYIPMTSGTTGDFNHIFNLEDGTTSFTLSWGVDPHFFTGPNYEMSMPPVSLKRVSIKPVY